MGWLGKQVGDVLKAKFQLATRRSQAGKWMESDREKDKADMEYNTFSK